MFPLPRRRAVGAITLSEAPVEVTDAAALPILMEALGCPDKASSAAVPLQSLRWPKDLAAWRHRVVSTQTHAIYTPPLQCDTYSPYDSEIQP